MNSIVSPTRFNPRHKLRLLIVALFVFLSFGLVFTASTAFAAPPDTDAGTGSGGGGGCALSGGGFLGFQPWYKYLQGAPTPYGCVPRVEQLKDIWLIVMAVIEILLRLAALAAIVFVVYGGIKLVASQGDPSALKQARQVITNALIGLVIAIAATATISFIAGRFVAS